MLSNQHLVDGDVGGEEEKSVMSATMEASGFKRQPVCSGNPSPG